ncbi:MAG: ABC transporter permease [Defluviitaleaceae bacterium]|nr:ABC transporter permease [Defluviitaleaceae bacterium]
MQNTIKDIKTMSWRCMLNAIKTPDSLIMSLVVPVILLLVFVNVFGGSMDIGGYNFVNFIIPGIMVNCLIQSSSSTGIGVNKDMTTGIVTRFRSMDISNVAFLAGHVLVAFIKGMATVAILIGVSFLVGFRPLADLPQWLFIIGLIMLFVMANTWLAVMLGVMMKSAESVGGFIAFYAVLVFLSPGMAPTENMPRALQIFAENQPMAPFITSIRSLVNGHAPQGDQVLATLLWWGGILILTFIATVYAYKKKLTV